MDVSKASQRCIKDVSRMFQWCFSGVERSFKWYFMGVLKVSQNCVGRMFQECSQEVLFEY